jgi:hypothetical protein
MRNVLIREVPPKWSVFYATERSLMSALKRAFIVTQRRMAIEKDLNREP